MLASMNFVAWLHAALLAFGPRVPSCARIAAAADTHGALGLPLHAGALLARGTLLETARISPAPVGAPGVTSAIASPVFDLRQ